MKVIIVDDEPRAHKVLEHYIRNVAELELKGGFIDTIKAYEFLKQNPVDLILLDISMPAIDGFTLLRMLAAPPLVIFTTAHAEFALESYEYDAVDYLKKPISFSRFEKAIHKALLRMPESSSTPVVAGSIDLRIDGAPVTIPLASILFIQSFGNYVKVVTSGRTYVTQCTTREMESILPRAMFIRIHKSYIVNKSMINSITEEMMIIDTLPVPIGRTFRKYVKDSVRESSGN
jgi:two-component system, LytTR family, response regulator